MKPGLPVQDLFMVKSSRVTRLDVPGFFKMSLGKLQLDGKSHMIILEHLFLFGNYLGRKYKTPPIFHLAKWLNHGPAVKPLFNRFSQSPLVVKSMLDRPLRTQKKEVQEWRLNIYIKYSQEFPELVLGTIPWAYIKDVSDPPGLVLHGKANQNPNMFSWRQANWTKRVSRLSSRREYQSLDSLQIIGRSQKDTRTRTAWGDRRSMRTGWSKSKVRRTMDATDLGGVSGGRICVRPRKNSAQGRKPVQHKRSTRAIWF